MSAKAQELHKVIDQLSETQLDALYSVAKCFVAQGDFDYFSPKDSEAINNSFAEMRQGDCLSFDSAEEMVSFFGVNLKE